jgi:hypothetical protein
MILSMLLPSTTGRRKKDPSKLYSSYSSGGVCGILLSPIFAEYGIASVPGCVGQEDSFLKTWNAACPLNQITQELVHTVIRLLDNSKTQKTCFELLKGSSNKHFRMRLLRVQAMDVESNWASCYHCVDRRHLHRHVWVIVEIRSSSVLFVVVK